MSHHQTSASSSNSVQQLKGWAVPERADLTTEGLGANTAILPMYWVSGQWMVPSTTSSRPQPQSQSQTQSPSTPNPWSAGPRPQNGRSTLSFGPQALATTPQTHYRPTPPPQALPSSSTVGSPFFSRQSSGSLISSTSGNDQYLHSSSLAALPSRPAADPAPVVAHQPTYHSMVPPRALAWDHEPRQRPQLAETRSDSRIPVNYGERRHKAHLDSEKRRRE